MIDSRRAPGERTARRDLELGGDEVGDAEHGGDRLGQEAVGRRRQDNAITRVAVLRDQRARAGADARNDRARDEAVAQRLPGTRTPAGERRRVEGGVLGRRDRAARVPLVDFAVRGAEGGAIENTLVDEELAPEEIGVAHEQRAVEIEQRETTLAGTPHAERRCQARGRVNAWMP